MNLARRLSFVALACVLAAVTGAQSPTPDGPPFVINEANSLRNENAHVAATGGSGFVVAWDGIDTATAYDAETVRVRAFSAPGVPVAGEFVAGYGDGYLDYYYGNRTLEADDIEVGPSGDFVVVWNEGIAGYYDVAILARAFDGTGTALDDEFIVSESNSYYDAKSAALAVDASGKFTVVWETRYTDGFGAAVSRRQFTADQVFLTDEEELSQTFPGDQAKPDIATIPGGGFLAVWYNNPIGADRPNITGLFYSSDNTPLGSEFSIAGDPDITDTNPAIARQADGSFLVVWRSFGGLDDDGFGIVGALLRPDGSTLTGPFLINQTTVGDQIRPKVAALPLSGGFIVVWEHEEDGMDPRAFARHILASRIPTDGQVSVDAAAGLQQRPSVSALDEGKFVVLWDDGDYGPTGSVFGRTFLSGNIFGDGFESGDLTAWTTSVQ